MSAERYADFLRDIGHRVIRTDSTFWFNVRPYVYLNFPYHMPVELAPGETHRLFWRGALAARYVCPVEHGRRSYRIACDDKNYSMGSLSSKTRNQTRRGLEGCRVGLISFSELLERGGLEVGRDTLLRQGRKVPKNHDQYWTRYYEAAESSEIMEAWGSFVDGKLAAFLVSATIEDSSNILIVRSIREHLNAYPNNALVFSFVKEALARPGISEVSYGLESLLNAQEGLLRFKQGMGFKQIPLGQRIEFNPILRPFLVPSIRTRARRYLHARPDKESYQKLANMLRWHSEQPRL